MKRLRTFFHVHRWNLWKWLDRNEKAWMRSVDRQLEADREIAEMKKRIDTLEGMTK